MNTERNIINKLRESKINEDAAYENFMRMMKENSTFKKMNSICSKYGYTLTYAVVSKTRKGKAEINIRPSGSNRYTPEIYYSSSFGQSPEFSIMTTSYGSLNISEHDKYLSAVINANKMVKELSKVDFNSLMRDDE